MKEYKIGEGLLKKGGLGSKPITPPPPAPKGQGGRGASADGWNNGRLEERDRIIRIIADEQAYLSAEDKRALIERIRQ